MTVRPWRAVRNPSWRNPSWRRAYLAAEYAALFYGGTTVYRTVARGRSPIPALLVLASAATVYLRRAPDFDRETLWRRKTLSSEAPSMAVAAGATALALTTAVAVTRREDLFDLPRRDARLWAAVMVFYPLFSVYPQEVVFRSFLFHRYAPVFGTGRGMIAASAAAFGYVHIIFGNWFSVAASGVGGWIFATRYLRTRSLFTASAEHALYGMLVFTVGLGRYFYHGAEQLARPAALPA
ncbi:CPBP family intramembrane glutamic endopeptidase [Nocardia bovistercoris]|uniref:CPBP family intramembrane metalloprotease n=1 Tax=Nocardia bovistercoris TaxID=2785916 RepID=A0A931II49_9NOCA|nr:CPBP family intramembrane glutamic endopeptidase [Nocardia bovistercoris]MBH0780130.1 CPBP family intramembrane metalloprotease [Nocardia bovistercoris]